MKTSALLIVAAAAVAVEASNPGDVKYNCAKPNANYCLGGSIILRCDENSVGTPGNCADNLAGYPPLGGTAECYESSKKAGDAACEKNCVVYDGTTTSTLPASECTPVSTSTSTMSGWNTTTTTVPCDTETITTTIMTTTPCDTETITKETETITTTIDTTVPCDTETITTTFPITTTKPWTTITNSTTWCPTGTGVPPPPGNGTTTKMPPPPVTTVIPCKECPGSSTTIVIPPGSTAATNTPPPPASTTTGATTVPTGAASVNRVGSLVAALGVAAAAFLV